MTSIPPTPRKQVIPEVKRPKAAPSPMPKALREVASDARLAEAQAAYSEAAREHSKRQYIRARQREWYATQKEGR